MSNTPLSDCITKLLDECSKKSISQFHEEFLRSQVGLILKGLPDLESGTKITVSSDQSIEGQVVLDPSGNRLIKVCADPEVFEKRYKAGMNATMSGRSVIEMMLKITDIKGLLVCSAASFHSFPIYRDEARSLLENGQKKKKWWKFW